ncbi:MAG: NAD(P)-dependent oxidoreductase [Planctomycetaceae bacterium]
MRKRLLVTGYGGFVAGSVVKQASDEWDITAISRSPVANGRADVNSVQLDLRERSVLQDVFEGIRPHAVIHAAAMANIDHCQSHPDEAEAVNVGVTKQLVRLCRDHGTKMVFCSTDTVFDGANGMYTEKDEPHPLNVYAETKVRAEQIVRGGLDDAVIARLSLVMGFYLIGAGNSFLARMIADFKAGKPNQLPANEIRTPIDVITLGRALLELAGGKFTGIVHLAGNTRLNRHEMACRIAQRLGFAQELAVATDSNAMTGRAPRPNDASLDNALARQILKTPMRSFDDGLELVLTTAETIRNGQPQNST